MGLTAFNMHRRMAAAKPQTEPKGSALAGGKKEDVKADEGKKVETSTSKPSGNKHQGKQSEKKQEESVKEEAPAENKDLF